MSKQSDAWDKIDGWLNENYYDWEVTHEPSDSDDRLGLRITEDEVQTTIHISITESGDVVPTRYKSDYSDKNTCEWELFQEAIKAVYGTKN